MLAALGYLLIAYPERRPALAAPFALYAHALLMLTAAAARGSRVAAVGRALELSGEVTSVATALVLNFFVSSAHCSELAVVALALAALGLVYAISDRQPPWFAASQAATAVAAVLGIAAALDGDGSLASILGNHVDLIALALTGVAASWTALRLALPRPQWQGRREAGFDRLLLGLVLVGTVTLALARLWPGVLAEMTGQTPVASVTAPESLGGLPVEGLLIGALALALLLNLWAVRRAVSFAALLTGLLVVGMTAPVLIARRFESDLAAASALRWGLGAAYLIGSAPFWGRASLARWAFRFGVRIEDPEVWRAPAVVPGLRDGVLALAAIVPRLRKRSGNVNPPSAPKPTRRKARRGIRPGAIGMVAPSLGHGNRRRVGLGRQSGVGQKFAVRVGRTVKV